MKKIVLIFMFASITLMVASESTSRTDTVQSRGQPQLHAEFNYDAIPRFVEFVVVPVEVESFDTEGFSPGIVVCTPNEIALMVLEGSRKIRDVDWCSIGNLYTNKNTDKRNAIKNKTPRLARGYGSTARTAIS